MDEMFAEEKSALQEGWAATYPQLWICVAPADSFWIEFQPCGKFFPFLDRFAHVFVRWPFDFSPKRVGSRKPLHLEHQN